MGNINTQLLDFYLNYILQILREYNHCKTLFYLLGKHLRSASFILDGPHKPIGDNLWKKHFSNGNRKKKFLV